MAELRSLTRLSIQGNGLTELDTGLLVYLELLNCSENALTSLSIREGPLRELSAKNNRQYDLHNWLLLEAYLFLVDKLMLLNDCTHTCRPDNFM